MTAAGLSVSNLTERELIARISGHLPPPPDWLVVGIGDDAAVVEPARNRLDVLTVDSLVEGIHFDRAFTPPDAVGHRALAVNLSDLAAMGADPRVALLSFALPPALPLEDFDAIVRGLISLANRHRVHVAGGNLTRSPSPLVLDVTVVGSVKRRRVLLRRGARPGDALYVTGTLGAAAAGLQMLREGQRLEREPRDAAGGSDAAAGATCLVRYLYPDPRLRVGALVGRAGAAAACVDLSDGLADGVRQITDASGVGAIVEAGAVPIDPSAREWFAARSTDPVEAAVNGGDDYELLFAVHPRIDRRFLAAAKPAGVTLTRIGTCTADRRLVLQHADRRQVPLPSGYAHFR